MRSPRALLCSGVAAVLTTAILAPTLEARASTRGESATSSRLAPTTATIRIMHNNISGAQHIIAGGGNGGPASIDRINQVLSQNPDTDVINMNEVCWNQALYFAALRPNWHWTYTWTKPNKAPNSQNGQNYCPDYDPGPAEYRVIGEFITSPHPISNVQDFCLEFAGDVRDTNCNDNPDSQISLLCADLAHPKGRVTTCTTHLASVGTQERQLAAIRSFVNSTYLGSGRAVFLTGDLNERVDATSMDTLYRQRMSGTFNGPGDFVEADQTDSDYFGSLGSTCNNAWGPTLCRSGQPTADNGSYNRKIDYIFVSAANAKPRLTAAGAGAMSMRIHVNEYSEHNILNALIKVNL